MKKWINKALSKHKKGALSKQLGIREEDNIPINLLNSIISAKAGEEVDNYTSKGYKRIKVTKLLKQRANLALNLKRIKR